RRIRHRPSALPERTGSDAMNTKLTTAAAVLMVMPLAACGSQDGGKGGGDDLSEGVKLSVPDSADKSSLTVVVEQAGLDVGDDVSVYAYRTPFDETEPNCQGDASPVGRLSVSADGVEPVA